MFSRRKQRNLLQEVREHAGTTATQARRVTAAGLTGAANALEPAPAEKRRRRRLPILLSALAGGLAAVKLARSRSHHATEESAPTEGSGTTSEPASPTATSTATATRQGAMSGSGNRSAS